MILTYLNGRRFPVISQCEMSVTNPRFKYNTSAVIGGRSFNDTTEHPFIPVPHRIILDARFSLAARSFAIWCYGKSSNYVFVKKNLCFELGITDQQRRTIFAELKKMGVLADVPTSKNNLHYWDLTLNFTIFDGVANLEERRKIATELSTKNQKQQVTPACAHDLLISTDHGSSENQQFAGVVDTNKLNKQGFKKNKNKQQAAVIVKNSVTNEDLEREIDEVMASVGGEIKNRAAYRKGIKRIKLKAIADAAEIAKEGATNTKSQSDARFICEQNLHLHGDVFDPSGFVCKVGRGDLGLFKNANGGIFLEQQSAGIWQRIHAGELDFRPDSGSVREV